MLSKSRFMHMGLLELKANSPLAAAASSSALTTAHFSHHQCYPLGMDGRMDEWIDGQMNGWMESR
jgi:hypothetical protein